MKCSFSLENSPVACHMEKRVTSPHEASGQTLTPRKRCVRAPVKPQQSPSVALVTFHSDVSAKGPHNKENYRKKLFTEPLGEVTSDDEVILSSGSFTEDSGYLSLHNSQLHHGDVDSDGPETSGRLPEEKEFPPSNVDVHSNHDNASLSDTKLPMLKFQQEVCKELAKSYRKTQNFDWTVVDKLAGNFGLHNVIGGKMGLECVDILKGLLKKDMRHILTRILGLLGDSDLINCIHVSKTWRKIICQEQSVLKKCREAEQRFRDNGRRVENLSRDFAVSRVVFSCMQSVSMPVHKPKRMLNQKDCTQTQDCTPLSRFQQFQEAARTLKQHEALKPCRRCGSPARCNSEVHRAVCTRLSCAFDFCTLCLGGFHGSSPCRTGVVRASSSSRTSPLAGSARSKRNIRRL